MWRLVGYNRGSDFFEGAWNLDGLRTDALKTILDLEDYVEFDGIRYPLEAGAFEIPPDCLRSFAEYLSDSTVIQMNLDFFAEHR